MTTLNITLSDAQMLALRMCVMKGYIDHGVKNRGREGNKEVQKRHLILKSLCELILPDGYHKTSNNNNNQ